MNDLNRNQNRRKFLAWTIISAAFLAACQWIKPPAPKKETVTMLTRDGKLVEVDITALSEKRKKITNRELQNWIEK